MLYNMIDWVRFLTPHEGERTFEQRSQCVELLGEP